MQGGGEGNRGHLNRTKQIPNHLSSILNRGASLIAPMVKKKKSACQSRRLGFDLWVRKIPWRRKWQPTLVFLPGKSHGQRSLVGYSPWGHMSWT